jgi:predicted nucleic acid-binding protein
LAFTKYYEQLCIIPEIYREVVIDGQGQPGTQETADANWIKVRTVQDKYLINQIMAEGLTFEDAAVIALAIETDAEIVLSDDAMVRARALAEGFQVTGTLGMLLRAKNDGFIESVRENIEVLEAAGFRIHPRLKTQILQRAGEW